MYKIQRERKAKHQKEYSQEINELLLRSRPSKQRYQSIGFNMTSRRKVALTIIGKATKPMAIITSASTESHFKLYTAIWNQNLAQRGHLSNHLL